MAKKPRAEEAQVKTESRRADRLLEPSLHNVDALVVDSVVCGLCSDVRPLAGLLGMIDWRLCGRVSRLIERGVITGDGDERILMPTLGRIPPPRLFVFGWGRAAQAAATAAERVRAMIEMVERAGAQRVAFAFPEPAAELLGHVDDVERRLGARLVALFGPDPSPPTP